MADSARRLLEELRGELTAAARRAWRTPTLSLAVVGTMALSLGVNAAAFSLADRVLFRSANVGHPATVIRPFVQREDQRGSRTLTDLLPRRSWKAAAPNLRAFSEFALEVASDGLLGDLRPPLRVSPDALPLDAVFVSHNYFRALGVPVAGPGLVDADDRPGGHPAVIASDALWRSRLGGDPSTVGQEISLGGTIVRLVGVAPRGFRGPLIGESRDLWVSLGSMSELLTLPSAFVDNIPVARGYGRLSPNTSLDQAASELSQALAQTLRVESLATNAYPVRAQAARSTDRTVVQVLVGTAGVVLLLGWFNLAAIFRAQSERRHADLRLRVALGISPRRLMMFRLSEPFVLTVVGGLVAIIVCEAVLRTFSDLRLPSDLSFSQLALHVGAGPVALASLVSFATMACAATVGSSDGAKPRLTSRRVLLVGYVGASLFLMLDAGLLVRTIQRGLSLDLGFDSKSAIEVIVQPRLTQYLGGGQASTPEILLKQLLIDVRNLPEVADAAAGPSPLWFSSHPRAANTARPPDEAMPVPARTIEVGGSAYFTAVGIPLISGRRWSSEEEAATSRTAIVSRSVARSNWPSQRAEGQIVSVADETFQVIGVVPDVARAGIRGEAQPTVFILPRSGNRGMVQFVVRARGDVNHAAQAVRAAADRVFPNSVQLIVTTMAERVRSEIAAQQLGALMFSWLAATAFALASLGVYGLVILSIAAQWREMAIRVSLGAEPWTLVRGVVAAVLQPVLAGCLLGLVAAFLTRGTLQAFLFQTSALDPSSMAASVLLQTFVAGGVALAAAWRVLHIDPIAVLRSER